MFYLYLKNQNLPAFENVLLELVCNDYFNYCVNNNCNPSIERVERCDNDGNIIEIILGCLIQNELELKISDYRKQSEIESLALAQWHKEAIINNGVL